MRNLYFSLDFFFFVILRLCRMRAGHIAKIVQRPSNNKLFVIRFLRASFGVRTMLWSGQLSFYEHITRYVHTIWLGLDRFYDWCRSILSACVSDTCVCKIHVIIYEKPKMLYRLLVCGYGRFFFIANILVDLEAKLNERHQWPGQQLCSNILYVRRSREKKRTRKTVSSDWCKLMKNE